MPLYIDKNSETLRVVQHLRDEAHRFGITHHRNRRSASALVGELDGIKGVGPSTAEALLRHFKSVKRIREGRHRRHRRRRGPRKASIVHAALHADE